MTHEQIIKKLRKDEHYFGEFGGQWMSNSDINTLLEAPDLYGQPKDESAALVQGRWIHTRMLEPQRLSEFTVIDTATRNNKAYQEAKEAAATMFNPKPHLLLSKDIEMMEDWAKRLEANKHLYSMLVDFSSPEDFEQPGIVDLKGYPFKGKADRVNHVEELTIDLKSTRNLWSFKENFYNYGYHTQAYIYKLIFGYDVVFIVYSKEDGRLAEVHVSQDSYAKAAQDIDAALETYELYYGSEPKEDIGQYYEFMTL